MDQINRALKMLISRNILVIRTGRAIISKAQAMPIAKMLIQQSLIGAVEADAPIRERLQGIVVLQVGPENHHPAIETIGPADVWDRSKVHVQGEELVRGSESYDIAINVHDPVVLRLSPELDLGKGRD